MSRDWRYSIDDMLDCCAKVREYTRGLDVEGFAHNSLVYDAVIRNLEIIGEAAKGIPEEVKIHYPEIEWRKIVGLRDVLAHFYFGLETETLWDIVQAKLPPLCVLLKRIKDENS